MNVLFTVERHQAHHLDTSTGGHQLSSGRHEGLAVVALVWPYCDRRIHAGCATFLVGQGAIACGDSVLLAGVATGCTRDADLAIDRVVHSELFAADVTRCTRTEGGKEEGLQVGRGDGGRLLIAATVCAVCIRHRHIFARLLLRVVTLLRHRLPGIE